MFRQSPYRCSCSVHTSRWLPICCWQRWSALSEWNRKKRELSVSFKYTRGEVFYRENQLRHHHHVLFFFFARFLDICSACYTFFSACCCWIATKAPTTVSHFFFHSAPHPLHTPLPKAWTTNNLCCRWSGQRRAWGGAREEREYCHQKLITIKISGEKAAKEKIVHGNKAQKNIKYWMNECPTMGTNMSPQIRRRLSTKKNNSQPAPEPNEQIK